MMLTLLCSMPFAAAVATAPMDSQAAAAALNAEFTGDVHSGGVVLRQMGEWSLFCGEDCYKGRPDCILSASFYNTAVGVDTDSTFGGFFPYGWGAGVTFNGTLARERLAKCFYMFDGNSYYRYNDGCGCMAAKADQGSCTDPHAPYFNIAPDGAFVDGDNEEYAKKCLCTDVNTEKHDADGNDCFWRGPAYNTSTGLYGGSEYGSVIQQRLNVVDSAEQWRWNEVVLDARVLQQILFQDPASAVVAVFYHNNVQIPDQNEQNLEKAMNIQSQMAAQYGIEFPIVELGLHVPVSKEKGPFSAYPPVSAGQCCHNSDCTDCFPKGQFCAENGADTCVNNCGGTWCAATPAVDQCCHNSDCTDCFPKGQFCAENGADKCVNNCGGTWCPATIV